MQPDTLIPREHTTLLYVVLASILGWIGGWLTRRKREPVELDKVRAETKSIHVTAENQQLSVGLETFRELTALHKKAEQRREEWNREREQMRNQIRFWRNKAEEFDGELIDSRNANVQLNARLKLKQAGLDKAAAIIHYHSIPFSEADLPEIKRLVNILNDEHR